MILINKFTGMFLVSLHSIWIKLQRMTNKNNVFKLVDYPRLYKEMVIELDEHTSERVHTT